MKKDKKPEKELKYEKLAKNISFIFTPAIVGTFFLVYTLYNFSPNITVFFKTTLLVFLFSVVIPVLFILYLVKGQKITNFHIKERKERVVPFAFAMVMSAVSILVIRYFDANPEMLRMILILYLMALGYVAITLLKFKISGHTFIFTSAMLVLTFYLDLRFIYLLPLVAVIGWARVHLKEHKIEEVIGGAVYAVASFVIFSLLINN